MKICVATFADTRQILLATTGTLELAVCGHFTSLIRTVSLKTIFAKSMPIVVIFISDALFYLRGCLYPLLLHNDAVLGSGRPFHYVGLARFSAKLTGFLLMTLQDTL